ncbi:hypothetical protein [Paenibacillus glacialis]|uniref:Uncharacterized protein n=1 Tax=Paenibacillus glacialis TaxID=494026 RepID=A0A168N0F3_9BACL|nr:hypothetical protein [Paenibacillus glacialis]OAB45252.1 hypothetical protein PGLA_03040 [Paenibacillus glacialis]
MKKYISQNELDHFSFHDCVIDTINIMNNEIIMVLESIDVLAEHSLNPYDVAKNTDACTIRFINVEQHRAKIYKDNYESVLPLVEMNDSEILKFDYKKVNRTNEYIIFGSASSKYNNNFSEIIIIAENVELGWNKYEDD